MEYEMNILLDMDGTIVNFMEGLQRANHYWVTREDWPEGEYELEKVLGRNLSYRELAYPEFWVNLKPYHGLDALITLLKEYGTIYYLTFCGGHGGAFEGKREWLYNHNLDNSKMVALHGNREWLKSRDNFLIDDNTLHHEADFVPPRVWNIAHQQANLCEVEGKFLNYGWGTSLLGELDTALDLHMRRSLP